MSDVFIAFEKFVKEAVSFFRIARLNRQGPSTRQDVKDILDSKKRTGT